MSVFLKIDDVLQLLKQIIARKFRDTLIVDFDRNVQSLISKLLMPFKFLRLPSNADKYDRKPKGDDQEMPRSIREIIKLKDAAKTMKKRKRNRKSLGKVLNY